MQDDLIERLDNLTTCGCEDEEVMAVTKAAKARIAALEADKARLRHALENATALIGHRMPMTETALVAGETLTASDVWRAGCDALRK